MAEIHGGRVVAKALKAEDVTYVFTLCGGHVMPIYDGCIDEGIRVIDTRHEQTAAHAADGWARVTGRPGVAVVTAGPGLTDAVTGVASAHRANIPMLIFGGQGPRPFADMGSLQDMNHVELMRPITKWAVSVPEGRRLAEYVSMAFRIATTGLPGPVYLEMPIDQLFNTYEQERLTFPTKYRTGAGIVMEQLTGLAKSEGFSAAMVKPWLDELRQRETQKSERMRPELESDAVPINPLRACKEIADVLPRNAIAIGDGGDFVATAASVLRIYEQGHWLDPGPLGTLGVGPGYAMAAKLAKPQSPVVIIYGDGSFGLHGMEFEAMVRQKINVVGIVGNDAAWQQIRRGQVQLYGEERAVATGLSFAHYEKVVEALGGHGEYVERPEQIRPAVERALGAGKPALVNIKIGSSDFRKDAISI